MKKSVLILCFSFLSCFCFSQTSNIPFKPNQIAWLQKKNFPTALYDFRDENINQYLAKAVRQKNTNTAVISAAVPLAIYPPTLLATIPVSLQIRSSFMSSLNTATNRWFSNNDAKTYDGDQSFRQLRRKRWYRKENILVDFYDGKIDYVNHMLDKAYNIRQQANRLYWTGGASGTLSAVIFALAIIHGQGRCRTVAYNFFVASAGLATGAGGAFIAGMLVKERARIMLNSAALRWYSEFGD